MNKSENKQHNNFISSSHTCGFIFVYHLRSMINNDTLESVSKKKSQNSREKCEVVGAAIVSSSTTFYFILEIIIKIIITTLRVPISPKKWRWSSFYLTQPIIAVRIQKICLCESLRLLPQKFLSFRLYIWCLELVLKKIHAVS